MMPRSRIFRVAALAAAALLAMLAAPARAEGIAVGSFCIEGVSRQELPRETVTVDNGVWHYRRFTYNSPTEGGRVVIFDRFITKDPMLPPTCDVVKATAAAQGAQILLEGRIRTLNLKVGQLTAGGMNSYVIARQDFEMTLGHVTSGFSTIGGGRMSLSGSRAWIGNPTRINISPTGMAGTLRIESWNRSLLGGVVSLAGGVAVSADFASANEGNTQIDFDTGTGNARLHRADLVASNVQLAGGELLGEMTTLTGGRLSARQLRILVADGRASVSVADALGTAESISLEGDSLTGRVQNARIAWSSAQAAAAESIARFEAGRLAFTNLSLSGPSGALSLGGNGLASGAASARFEELSNARVAGRVDFTAPSIPALDFILPAAGVQSASLGLQGSRSALAITGTLRSNRLAVAGLAFGADTDLAFSKSAAATEIRIPVNLSIGNISGSFSASDRDQRAIITARLKRLAIRGEIVLDIGDLARSRFEMPAGGFGFELESAVAAQPILAGTRPTFAAAQVTARNSSQIVVARDGAVGNVDITTPVLVLGQPIFRIGEGGRAARVSADFTAAGNSVLRYDLATSGLSILDAVFQLSNLTVAPLEPGYEAELGGYLVREPRIRLSSLVLTIRNGVGLAAGENFVLEGESLRNAPRNVAGLQLRGRISSPLAIRSLGGLFAVEGTKMDLQALDLQGVSFGIRDATIGFGRGMDLRRAAIGISADRIVQVNSDNEAAKGLFFGNLRVNGEGRLNVSGDFSLANDPTVSGINGIFGGRSDRLTGAATATLGPLVGTLDMDLNTAFRCSSGSPLILPVRAALATGPSSVVVTARDGAFSTEGQFTAFPIQVVSRATRRCSSTPERFIIQRERRASMTGWCPTWRKPRRTCRWSTVIVPEISVTVELKAKILAFSAGIFFTAPRIRIADGHQRLCNIGPTHLQNPVIVGGIYPQLSNPTLLNQAINVLVENAAIAFESSLATGVLSGLTGLVNIVGSSVPYYCRTF